MFMYGAKSEPLHPLGLLNRCCPLTCRSTTTPIHPLLLLGKPSSLFGLTNHSSASPFLLPRRRLVGVCFCWCWCSRRCHGFCLLDALFFATTLPCTTTPVPFAASLFESRPFLVDLFHLLLRLRFTSASACPRPPPLQHGPVCLPTCGGPANYPGPPHPSAAPSHV